MTPATIPPRKLRALAQRFDLERTSVLDVGCGRGVYLEHFSRASLGIDRDPACVETLRARGLRAEVRDVARAGWSRELGRFDLVWLCDLLVHLAEPGPFLDEVPALLNPGGRVVVVEWLWPESEFAARALSYLVPEGRATFTEPEHLQRFGPRSMTELLRERGFEIEALYNHSFASAAARALLDSFWPPRTIVARPVPQPPSSPRC